MRIRSRGAAVVGASFAAAVWLGVGGAAGQVPTPTVPPTPDSTTPPAPAPPSDDAPGVPEPAEPPAPPETVAPGGPGTPAPATPVTPAPAPTTTTTVPKAAGAGGTPPARTIDGAAPARFTLDLSEIDALRRQARGKGPRAPQPDYGFESSLPFQPGGEENAVGAEEALELGAEEEHIARVRSAGAVAGGLTTFVLLGIVLWVLRQARPRDTVH